MTASTLKERYRNRIKSFNHKRYSNDTELSKYIWKLKDNKQDFDITWSVLKQSISYTGGSKRCNANRADIIINAHAHCTHSIVDRSIIVLFLTGCRT